MYVRMYLCISSRSSPHPTFFKSAVQLPIRSAPSDNCGFVEESTLHKDSTLAWCDLVSQAEGPKSHLKKKQPNVVRDADFDKNQEVAT